MADSLHIHGSGRTLPMLKTLQSADGTKISAETFGDGRYTFVLAHGFTGSRERPAVRANAEWFSQAGRVVLFDQRGHGKSSGKCSFGLNEPMDIDAVVGWARELSDKPVITVGFSMGSAVAIRHAALTQNHGVGTPVDHAIPVQHAPDATMVVGATSQWYYKGTDVMAKLHTLSSSPFGRLLIRWRRGVTLDLHAWAPEGSPREQLPIDPAEAASLMRNPLLIVHGELDNYFPVAHAELLLASAQRGGNIRSELWVEAGMGHAERATSEPLVTRMIAWADGQLG